MRYPNSTKVAHMLARAGFFNIIIFNKYDLQNYPLIPLKYIIKTKSNDKEALS